MFIIFIFIIIINFSNYYFLFIYVSVHKTWYFYKIFNNNNYKNNYV